MSYREASQEDDDEYVDNILDEHQRRVIQQRLLPQQQVSMLRSNYHHNNNMYTSAEQEVIFRRAQQHSLFQQQSVFAGGGAGGGVGSRGAITRHYLGSDPTTTEEDNGEDDELYDDDEFQDEESGTEDLLPPHGGGAEADDEGMLVADYEPTEQEIVEYCEWLGVDPVTEKCLMWIAREALKAPLPESWRLCYTDDRDIYYFNVRTGESIWDHPMDSYYKALSREEKIKLEKKRRRFRSIPGSLTVRPLQHFFAEISETCGVGDFVLPSYPNEAVVGSAEEPWKEVPEAFVDVIDFRPYVDPVVLPTSGRTVSRHTIINSGWRDPFTRQYCENHRLVPNVDKRMEVDRWLQQLLDAYVRRMRHGTLSGVARMIIVLPFLLDRDEEVCVRGQRSVLNWLVEELKRAAKEEAVAVSVAAVPVCEVQPKQPPPQKTESSKAVKSSQSSTQRKASAPAPLNPNALSNSTAGIAPIKKLQAALSNSRAKAEELMSKGAPVPPAPLSPSASPKSTETISFDFDALLTQLMKEGSHSSCLLPRPELPTDTAPTTTPNTLDMEETLLLSLLSMCTSTSRETLLTLLESLPRLRQHKVFRGFDEDVLFMLHLSAKDLYDLALSIHKQSLQIAAANTPRNPAAENVVEFRIYSTTNCDYLLQLRTLMLLGTIFVEGQRCAAAPDTEAVMMMTESPLRHVDFVTAVTVILAMVASNLDGAGALADLSTSATSKVDPRHEMVLELLCSVDGWPSKIPTLSETHISLLTDLALRCGSNPKRRLESLFNVCLHGSERFLWKIQREAASIRDDVVGLLTQQTVLLASSLPEDSVDAAAAAADCSSAELMGAVMVFHEIVPLEQFASLLDDAKCPPTAVLRIAYNLSPRLMRSVWKPKHFQQTLQTFIELVEGHPLAAWSVVERIGFDFYVRELSKKKYTQLGAPSNPTSAADVKARLNALENQRKPWDERHTQLRWAKLSLKLVLQRKAEVAKDLQYRREQRRLRLNLPPAPPTGSSCVAPDDPSPMPARRNSSKAAPQDSSNPTKLPSITLRPQPQQQQQQIITTSALSLCENNNPPQPVGYPLRSPLPLETQLERVDEQLIETLRQRGILFAQILRFLLSARLKVKRNSAAEERQSSTASATPSTPQQQQQQQSPQQQRPPRGDSAPKGLTNPTPPPPQSQPPTSPSAPLPSLSMPPIGTRAPRSVLNFGGSTASVVDTSVVLPPLV